MKHFHEDDSVVEMLRFTLKTFHQFLNLFVDAQRRIILGIFPTPSASRRCDSIP